MPDLFLLLFFSASSSLSYSMLIFGKLIVWKYAGEENLGSWKDGILSAAAAQAPGPSNDGPTSTLVLAGNRTKRPDILSGFRKYRGGWDIDNKHYWAVSSFLLC